MSTVAARGTVEMLGAPERVKVSTDVPTQPCSPLADPRLGPNIDPIGRSRLLVSSVWNRNRSDALLQLDLPASTRRKAHIGSGIRRPHAIDKPARSSLIATPISSETAPHDHPG